MKTIACMQDAGQVMQATIGAKGKSSKCKIFKRFAQLKTRIHAFDKKRHDKTQGKKSKIACTCS